MSKRITAVAASALALALGCEQQAGRTAEDDQIVGQREETVTEEETGFNQEPADQRRQQQMQQRQQMGQQHGQQGQQMGQGSPGQIVTEESQNNMDRTLSQLNRQLRENDFDVVATVRYDQRMRERAMREQGQQGQQGQRAQQQQRQQQQGMQQGGQGQEIGDVRLILFRRTNEEARAIQNQGPELLLKAPRALLVYERGDDVIVSYQTPEDMPAVGMEEPTTEVLQRIVRQSTQGRQQQTAQREQQQQEQQAQRMEQQAQGEERQAQREQQQAEGQEQQAQRQQQQAQREEQQAEQERQAMTQRQRDEQAGIQN